MPNRKQDKLWIYHNSDSVTPTTDLGFVENLANLHDLLETIRSEDGNQILASKIRISYRLYEPEEALVAQAQGYMVVPVAVQTAGTITDTVNLAIPSNIGTMLNTATDDVFGYQLLKKPADVSRTRAGPGNTGDSLFTVESSVEVPGNLLFILNKETETERLQNIFFCLVGSFAKSTDPGFRVDIFIEIYYQETRKTIQIR